MYLLFIVVALSLPLSLPSIYCIFLLLVLSFYYLYLCLFVMNRPFTILPIHHGICPNRVSKQLDQTIVGERHTRLVTDSHRAITIVSIVLGAVCSSISCINPLIVLCRFFPHFLYCSN
jgi:hypothetical protein